jgi:hypothetical protein
LVKTNTLRRKGDWKWEKCSLFKYLLTPCLFVAEYRCVERNAVEIQINNAEIFEEIDGTNDSLGASAN